jgi:CheY-like chemotaxis protein
LEQVIMNLVTNAHEAMPEGGTLRITIEEYQCGEDQCDIPAGEYICFSVSDTGVGMTEETQSRVFEPFFTTKKGGSGLGLSTVYGIVKQSGGYIRVKSAPHQGATFSVCLPKVSGPDLRRAPEAKKPAHAIGNETILLVDNEEDLRNAVCEYLEGCGYRVLTAGDGREAAAICDEHEGAISLLISDIVMPKLNGRGLVEHVRKARPQTNVLVISGYADDAVLSHGISLDSSSFLQKPFTFQALGAKIRAILDKER